MPEMMDSENTSPSLEVVEEMQDAQEGSPRSKSPQKPQAVPDSSSPEEEEVDKEDADEKAKVEPKEDADEDFSQDTEATLVPVGSVHLNPHDASFSADVNDRLSALYSIQADGFNNLYAAVRSNHGFVSGRYYFEVKMIDTPRMVRVGFTTLQGSLYLEDGESFYFEANGDVSAAGEKSKAVNPRWTRTDIWGFMLNVPKKCITVYVNGEKTPGLHHTVTIPEAMFTEQGTLKNALFPTIASKSVAVECNFSRSVWKNIPFKPRPVGHAKLADVVAAPLPPRMEPSLVANGIVQVTVPMGFDTAGLIDLFKKDQPEGTVLTQGTLSEWGEKSGLVRRSTQRGGERFGIVCLDSPMSVFPMLLKAERKYLISLNNNSHNLLPANRADTFAKLQHACNVHLIGYVDVDNIIATVDGEGNVARAIRDEYERVKLPSMEEGFERIVYHSTSGKSQAELKAEVEEKFTAWKKDCKLKSKVENLKKSDFFQKKMDQFNNLKSLQHKGTAELARKHKEKTQLLEKTKKQEQANAKKLQREKEKQMKIDAGMDEAAAEAELGPVEVEEDKEENEFPEIMSQWSEEDWMLALLRCELHTLVHAFVEDVNDPERASFPVCHFAFYYQLYTQKTAQQQLMAFSVKTVEEMSRLIPEIYQHSATIEEFALRKMIRATEKGCGTSSLKDLDLLLPAMSKDTSPSVFIKQTEEARQQRSDLLAAGDELAALFFTYRPLQARQPQQKVQQPQPRPDLKRPQQGAYAGFDAKRRATGSVGQTYPVRR